MNRLPWKTSSTFYEQNMGVDAHVVVSDADGKHIALCGYPGAPKSDDIINVQSIVNAVNKGRELLLNETALIDALQPFIKNNSSEETISVTVKTSDIRKARMLIARIQQGLSAT